MAMMALHCSRAADSATPWAWLPADAATTPRRSSSADSEAILLYAPRSLNENTGWVSSRLNQTELPVRADSWCA
ncbi:hypothetical protein D9M70_538810 [compost metagenome]